MSTSPVINGLRRKHAEVSGEIRQLDARIHDLRRDLAHIDATLKLFDPAAQPRLIKPVRPYKPQNRVFAPKELSIRVMNALREAEGGLALEAIVARVMAEKGLDATAERTIRRVTVIAL